MRWIVVVSTGMAAPPPRPRPPAVPVRPGRAVCPEVVLQAADVSAAATRKATRYFCTLFVLNWQITCRYFMRRTHETAALTGNEKNARIGSGLQALAPQESGRRLEPEA